MFETQEVSLLKSIDRWLELQYSFEVAKEAARLGLVEEDRYKSIIKAMHEQLCDLHKTDEKNSSHSEESE